MQLFLISIIAWKYHVYMSAKLIEIFRQISMMHICSSEMFSIDERKNLANRLNRIVNKYSLGSYSAADMFKLCDDMNYITLQTSAHELELIAWQLIELKLREQFFKWAIPLMFFLSIVRTC
jgi:hypothetical protein